MERGAAWVELVNPEGDAVDLPDAADLSIEEQIREALGGGPGTGGWAECLGAVRDVEQGRRASSDYSA